MPPYTAHMLVYGGNFMRWYAGPGSAPTGPEPGCMELHSGCERVFNARVQSERVCIDVKLWIQIYEKGRDLNLAAGPVTC